MRLFPLIRFTRGLTAMLGALVLAGCAHYQLGSGGPLPFRNLYVSVVRNQSFAAQAQAPVTEMIRQSLLQENRVTLTDQTDADATLDVTLSDYQRAAAATQQGNTLNAQSYSLTLTALCTLVDNRSGKVYFKNRRVSVTEEAFVQGGDSFSESEYQSMPKLARDLGTKIKDEVTGGW